MNRMTVGKVSSLLLGFCTLLLLCTNPAWAQTTTQTTTPPPAKTPPPPAKPKPAAQPAAKTPAQPAAKPTPATPASPANAAKTPVTPTPASPANPAAASNAVSSTAKPSVIPAAAASTTGTSPAAAPASTLPAAASSAASSAVPGVSSIPGASAASSAAANPGNALLGSGSGSNGRSALTAQGVGAFHWADFTLTAYGCYRATTRILCDFDLTKQNNAQMNLGAFYNVAVVDDGGKITARHDAYYLASDGTHMTVVYLSPTPVRYIMEYDNIDANLSSVSLVFGTDRLQGVPITAGDLSASGSGTGGRGLAGGSGSGASGAPGGASGAGGAAGDPRAALTAQGLGTFRGGDFTLTAYGCYRTDTRILCDFDITKQNNAQMNLGPFYTVAVVDDGGKITSRHDAYYLGTDGTHMTTAFLSATPTRYIMEYDNVGTQFTKVSLINGGDQIQGVPVTTMSASQPAGTIPNRGGAPAAGTTTAQNQPGAPANGANPANPAGATDQASQAINKANDAKKKAKSLLDQLKSVASKPQ